MPPKKVAKKNLVCWTKKDGKVVCAGKDSFKKYKPRKTVKKPVVKKAVVKKAVVKKPVVKKPVVKKATKKSFSDAKKEMLDNIPLSIDGQGMITMNYEEAEKAIKRVKKEDNWEKIFKKIKDKIDESVKIYS